MMILVVDDRRLDEEVMFFWDCAVAIIDVLSQSF